MIIEYIIENTIEIAGTTKDPKVLTDILKMGKDDWVSCIAASNLSCPKEILVEILRREKDDDVSRYAARNPNCPKEILVEVLERGKGDIVSLCISYNTNCPIEEKIKWMQATGKIEKEDPSKHIIEYEDNKKDDLQDLQDLQNLLKNY